MELAAGLIGVVVGASVTVVLAWLDRRWRIKDVRAAETRARTEQLFDPVWRYAAGLHEFIHDTATWLGLWQHRRPHLGSEDLADQVRARLATRWEHSQELRPRPGPSYALRDSEATGRLIVLEMLARGCHASSVDCLDGRRLLTKEEIADWQVKADSFYDNLLARMQALAEAPEA